jgi:ribonuclease VapC
VIVDTSAVLAILRDEPEAPAFVAAMHRTPVRRMSAANLLEASIVVDASGDPVASRKLDELIARVAMIVEPVTPGQVALGRAAYRDFGKGSGHPARLNMGDCFAYALAKDRAESLLFKGNDFIHTDVDPAWLPGDDQQGS